VVGLAVLLALHISHARDVKRLREWAGGARERSGPGVTAVPSARQTVSTPPRSQPWYRRIGTRPVAVALLGLLVGGGAAARLTGHDGGADSGKAQANRDNGLSNKPRRSGATVKPGNVTVAVLNGTTVPGLAAALRDQIAAAAGSASASVSRSPPRAAPSPTTRR
jgi:anti-sigma factor RsiW